MLLQQLSKSWCALVEDIYSVKENRETVTKVLQRMTHRQLAGTFACYSGHVDTVQEQRERVQRTMARWRTLGVQKVFDCWRDYIEITIEERAEEAKELVRQEMECKLESGHISAQKLEVLRAQEAQRRILMSKRVIARMLRQHLTIVWTGVKESFSTTKTNRETVRRVLGRMTHQQLSGAFQRYFESVKDYIRVKMICTRLLQRM